MKKLLTFLIIIFTICSYSQGTTYKYFMYLYNSSAAPQFGIVNGVYKYIGTDSGLKTFFANYSISKFQKEYPSITDDEYFKQILRLETTSSSLATALMTNYASTYVKYVDITNMPLVELLSYPNDYGATNPITQPPYTGSAINRSDLDYMQVNRAWDITTGKDLVTGLAVDIGISDATILTSDDDFNNGKVTFINPYTGSFEPHGTEISGIAAARGDNSYGSTGVCYDCNIVGTWYGNYDNLELLARSGVRVINMSWASMYSTKLEFNEQVHQDHQRIITRIATKYRTVLVAGAGNQSSYQTATDWYCEGGSQSGPSWTGMRYGFPACFDDVISVSSVFHESPYTLPLNTSTPSLSHIVSPTGVDCYGLQGAVGTVNGANPSNPVGVLFNGWPRPCGNPFQYYSSPNGLCDAGHTKNPQVDILAPTHDTFKFYLFTTSGHPIIYAGGGTSGCAPRVSGTVGLMLSVNSCLYPNDVDAILKLTSYDVENSPINSIYDGNIGGGALNTGEAVTFVNEMKLAVGLARIRNHNFNRFNFILDKFNNKLEIENVLFGNVCRADFTARKEIRVLPGSRFSPNIGGKVNLKINSSMDISCPPIDYSKMASTSGDAPNQKSKTVLYPNPNNGSFDLFNVNFEEFGNDNLNVFVFDINGRKIYDSKLFKNNGTHINIPNLTTGVYILKLSSDYKSEEIKFIKY